LLPGVVLVVALAVLISVFLRPSAEGIVPGLLFPGIAGLLMEALLRGARERGVQSVEGLVLADNTEMLRFVRALGFDTQLVAEDRTTVRIVKKF